MPGLILIQTAINLSFPSSVHRIQISIRQARIEPISEFDTLESGNPEFLLALCDLRLLAGDVALFDDLLVRVHRGDETRAPRLVAALLDLMTARHASFNDTLYQLEPDLKNAPGGLRDIAAIRLLRMLAPEAFATRGRVEGERIEDAEEFLLRIRSLLHVQNNRDANDWLRRKYRRGWKVRGL